MLRLLVLLAELFGAVGEGDPHLVDRVGHQPQTGLAVLQLVFEVVPVHAHLVLQVLDRRFQAALLVQPLHKESRE